MTTTHHQPLQSVAAKTRGAHRFPCGKFLREIKIRRVKEIRAELIGKLGGKCVHCGVEDHTVLQFDHIHTKTWVTRQLPLYNRYLRYKKEVDAGLLQLLCADCNKRKGAVQDAPKPKVRSDNPF